MRKQLQLLLGLEQDSSARDLRRQYHRLMDALLESNGSDGSDRYEHRLAGAREKVCRAFESVKASSQGIAGLFERSEEERISRLPKIGEILVDFGVINLEQLEAVLKVQRESKDRTPVGRLLVGWNLLSWEQLAQYLRIQDLLKLPASDPRRMARQLLELGLITQEELDMAEIDRETVGCSVIHAICRRGWVKENVISCLYASPSLGKSPSKENTSPTIDKARENSDITAA